MSRYGVITRVEWPLDSSMNEQHGHLAPRAYQNQAPITTMCERRWLCTVPNKALNRLRGCPDCVNSHILYASMTS